MEKDPQTIKDIAVLQTQVQEVGEKVDKIIDNHLPHLQADVDKIRLQMAYYIGGFAALGFILQIVLKFVK